MEITKIFSDNQGNERLYTVLMSGDELKLYSEFQKEFARRDYEGLTSEQASRLRENRNQIAQTFKNSRKQFQNSIGKLESSWNSVKPGGSGMYVENNGTRLNIIKNNKTTFNDAVNQASKFNATQDLKSINSMKNLARQDALKNTPNFLQINKGKLAIGAGLTAGALATAAYLRNKQKDKEE